jgi:hypothetical protein
MAMTTLDTASPLAPARARAQRWHRPLMLFTAAMVVLAVVAVGGLLFDHRTLGGAPIWLKPFKFAVSFGIYGYTLAWLLIMQRRLRRTGWAVGTVIAVSGAAEIALIVWQVVRGRASHFNISTDLDATIFNMMGALAGLVFVATFLLACLLAFEPTTDHARRWSVRFGLLSALVGMGLAVLMLANVSPAEAVALHGGTPTAIGGHSVGVPDGGPGMPITDWSTTGGDLRIPHFLGLHGLQALPLLGLLLTALASRFPVLRAERTRIRLLMVGAAGYGGLIALVTWQALRGQSIVHPDVRTLAASGALVVAVVVSTAIVLGARRPKSPAARRP